MADIKYKLDWVPDADKLKEQATEESPRKGIAARPAEVPTIEGDYYTRMYKFMKPFFDSEEEAKQSLSGKKPDGNAVKSMTMEEYEREVRESADLVSQARGRLGITQSLTEGGGEAFRTKSPEGTSPRPVARPDPLEDLKFRDAEDAPKAIEEPAPVTVEELDAAPTGGLMSPRMDKKGEAPATPTTDLAKYTSNFAEVYLKEHEGLKPHKSLEGGKDTAALGVKFSLGLKRSDYSSDAEFAGAVALKHRDKAKAKFGEAKWDNLPESVKFAMTDLNYNTGTVGSSGDKADATAAMKNTLDFIGMTTKAGEEASLISLAKRRAWNWNKASSDIGESEIAKIKQIPTDSGGTKFEYLDSDDNIIHSTTTSRKPVKLNKSGKATTLTSTREITL